MRALLVAAVAVACVEGRAEQCNIDLYPSTYPPTEANMTVPYKVVNLDLLPMDRWTAIGTEYKAGINKLINVFLNHSVGGPSTPVGHFVERVLNADSEKLLSKLPKEYAEEIRGLSMVTGLDLGYMILFQLAYELEGLCTSIVAQDAEGKIWHGRNLDFGLFSGYNWTEPEGGGFPGAWELTEALRPLILKVDWQKNGTTIFSSVQYAGYIGVHTGMKKGMFGMSVDSRFDNNLDKYLLDWLFGSYEGEFLTLATRTTLTQATSYAEAKQQLSTFKTVGPSYIILSGIEAGEGCVLTRGPNMVTPIDTWDLADQLKKNTYFVLETNYDHWKKPPIFDNRRDSAVDCMNNTIGQAKFNGFVSLYDVLSAGPNLNRLTTFTWLAHPATGEHNSYKRRCTGVHGGHGVPGSGTWEFGCAMW
eukprot:TRINITY_DN285_c0_g2_i1.p1 TRINITY_DN285_c0_g2~~TRINITY_DN285_c0_g2_i1.p1  ORF type:complete len:440 (+),score=166.80 TRINITY_DN285_c0_g2_i1:67-1320(+)